MTNISVIEKKEVVLDKASEVFGRVEIPKGVVHIYDNVFAKSEIESIQLPSTLETIGSAAFKECKNLRKIEIPHGVTKIGFGAFSGCSSLEYVSIPNTVASIKADLFDGCSALKKIIVPLHLAYQAAEVTSRDVTIQIKR